MAGRFRAGGYGYGDAKKALFEMLWEYFRPFRTKREELVKAPGIVDEIRKKGEDKARAVAIKTLTKVRELVGVK